LFNISLKHLHTSRSNQITGKFLILYAILLAIPAIAGAQNTMEVGLFGGGSYYLGDLNPGVHYKGTKIAYGLLARYNIDERWAVKLSAYRGEVKGSTSTTNYLPERDLTFNSPITDVSAVVEFNFFPYWTGSKRNSLTPFIYTGVGVFFFKPMAGSVQLQPLGTEGQNISYDGRKPYNLTQVNIPFGIGGKLSIGKRLGLTVFWEMHKTFTDYLDDISTTYYLQGPEINKNDPAEFYSDPSMSYEPGMQRGNPDNKDWYSFSGITITYKFALGNKKKCRDLYAR